MSARPLPPAVARLLLAAAGARPPRARFDRGEADAAPGPWFFDPAGTVKRHFRLGADFSTAHLPPPSSASGGG